MLVDDTSWIEIGSAGGAALGALTVDPGALASGAGTLNLAGPVIDRGFIEAQGGTLLLGMTTGAGTLGIGTEATPGLDRGRHLPDRLHGRGGQPFSSLDRPICKPA